MNDDHKLKIKNKLPAPVQITAEQLLREATERLAGDLGKKKYYLGDTQGNLLEYQQRERQKFEDAVRRSRSNMSIYTRYAAWEEAQVDYPRARSVYERALTQDPRAVTVWLRYAEAEMRLGNVNLARNVWDRAVTILPRIDQFWFKRIHMEEVVGDVEGARSVWERWMKWEPEEHIWRSFVKFECRQKQWVKARGVYERMIGLFNTDVNVWQSYAAFEEKEAGDKLADGDTSLALKHSRILRARSVYERSLGNVETSEPQYLIEFAKFESRCCEVGRARAIYAYTLSKFPDSDPLRYSYVAFEKQQGDPALVHSVVLEKRRKQYEKRLLEAPFDYDGWFDLLRLEEDLLSSVSLSDESSVHEQEIYDQQVERVREAYEKAIAQIPPIQEKTHWRRYVYIWLFYALFEESVREDWQKAVEILKMSIRVIPHQLFTFAKVWVALGYVYVRQGNMKSARLALGQALGRCPKPKLFKEYLKLELGLKEYDRCRTLLEKQLEYQPHAAVVWIRYAEFEREMGDDERAKAIYELALSSEVQLDIPELVWKAYIDWEVDFGRIDSARALYERLLMRTVHVKVWVSYANMELLVDSAEDLKCANIRKIMKRAFGRVLGDERVLLVEAWRELEVLQDNHEYVSNVLVPKYFPVYSEDGSMHYPIEQEAHGVDQDNKQRLLDLAKKWKSAN